MSDSIDRVRSVATSAAHAALADLVRTGEAPRPTNASASGEGWRVTVLVSADAGDRPDLTACERDVLSILAGHQGRMSSSKVLSELEQRSLFHGESTVKRALARLHKLKLLGNSRKAPRGYWLLAVLPLFPLL